MFILAFAMGAVFYIFFNMFLYDVLICKVLNSSDNVAICKAVPWFSRPAYFFGFGIGTQMLCFVETKEISRDGLEVEKDKKRNEIIKKQAEIRT